MIDRRATLALLGGVALPLPTRASFAPPRSEIDIRLAEYFEAANTAGTFVGYRADEDRIIASDAMRSRQGQLPASTFKIANALIALETGVVGDPDKDVFKWDGVNRDIAAWNADHTLRSAMAVSAVPVYQAIARRIGSVRMQRCLDAFNYGNRSLGGGIDQFWLTGDLRIDPIQQIDFLDRLRRGALPASARGQRLVGDILPVTRAGDALIRYKTGLLGAETGKPSLGWLVGWVERGSAPTVFALNLDHREPAHAEARMTIARKCLAAIGAL